MRGALGIEHVIAPDDEPLLLQDSKRPICLVGRDAKFLPPLMAFLGDPVVAVFIDAKFVWAAIIAWEVVIHDLAEHQARDQIPGNVDVDFLEIHRVAAGTLP